MFLPRKPAWDDYAKGVATRLSNGKLVKQIEVELNTTPGRINASLNRMREHFNAKNTIELIAFLIRNKYIE